MSSTIRSARQRMAGLMLWAAISAVGIWAIVNAAESSAAAAGIRRPNIVFVYTDDQAPWALGISGNPQAKTPNMDRLFREGAYLVNSFTVTPVCSPSRASLMTSRYGTELGITDWINSKKEPDLGLDPAVVTWPDVLAVAGYHNGLIGKWHLGDLDRYHPTNSGFHYFMGFRGGGTRLKDATLEIDGGPKKFSGFTVNVLTEQAIEFIHRNQDRPFLLCVHYRSPHAPWLPLPEEDWLGYKDLDPEIPNPDYPKLNVPRVKRMMREYLGSVASVDRNLGRILAVLDKLDLARKTAVIYTSDHGYNVGHNGIWHKGNGHWIVTEPPPATPNVPKGQRPNMYDHSIRVPTAVRWPELIRPGTVITETISNLDWYPTILAMARVEVPEGVSPRGRSFLPLLEGKPMPGWNNDLYGQYSTHHQSRTHMRMYRTPRWKLVRDFHDSRRDELYDLRKDPAETTNLIGELKPRIQNVVRELHARLVEEMRRSNDPLEKLAPR